MYPMRPISSILIALFLSCGTACGQTEKVTFLPEDQAIFARYHAAMYDKKELSRQEQLIETALFFLGTPYVGATLEKEPEHLVINLREMDCTTFVENVICLTQTLQYENPDFDRFCHNLRQLRYREGEISDYTDRLHYTSDWIFTNAKKGWVRDVTQEIGGKPLPLNLSFMSTHPESYKPLIDNAQRIALIREQEEEINGRSCFYIPKAEIDARAKHIQNGDMLGFVTTINGLDFTHMGIAYWNAGELTFIHASSAAAKKVVVQEESLSAYTQRMKSNKGIVVVRLLPGLD